jgi:hypothetical protein
MVIIMCRYRVCFVVLTIILGTSFSIISSSRWEEEKEEILSASNPGEKLTHNA